MFGMLRFIRGFFGLLAILMTGTIFNFIHDLGGIALVLDRWDKFVETGLFYTWVSYMFIALISAGIFYILHKIINRIYHSKHGVPHPSLKNLWNL